MAITTARDLIRSALGKLGVLGIAETPSADDSTVVFEALNLMIDSWSVDNLMHSVVTEANFSLTNGTGSYSIGLNQTLDTTKPLDVLGGYTRSNKIDYTLDVVDKRNYNAEADKTISGIPTKVYYDKDETQQANRSGTLYFHPVPDSNSTLYLTIVQPFTEFSSLDSDITFPVGYKKALVENLAVAVAPEFGASVSKELAYNAEKSLSSLININSRSISGAVTLDIPSQLRSPNIYEGY